MDHETMCRGAQAMADAALPFIPAWDAAECANNIAQVLAIGEDPVETCTDALRHRVRNFGLRCGDIGMAAACMAVAWRRATDDAGLAMRGACGGEMAVVCQ